jgi:hypothetical protein
MGHSSACARRCFIGVGFLFCLIAVLQAALLFGDVSWSAFFGAPRWALVVVREGGFKLAALGGLAIGGSIGIALCCFSGGGLVRPFRGQRAVLGVIGGGLTTWGLRLMELVALRLQGQAGVRWQLYLIRGAPLAMGIVLLWGVWALRTTPLGSAGKVEV